MNADEIKRTIVNLQNPVKDPERDVYPEARTLRALGVDVPKEIHDKRPIAKAASWMIKVLVARLTQIDPAEAAKFLPKAAPQLPANPVPFEDPEPVAATLEAKSPKPSSAPAEKEATK